MFWFLIMFFFPFPSFFWLFWAAKLVWLDFLKVNFSDELNEFRCGFLCVNWNSIVVKWCDGVGVGFGRKILCRFTSYGKSNIDYDEIVCTQCQSCVRAISDEILVGPSIFPTDIITSQKGAKLCKLLICRECKFPLTKRNWNIYEILYTHTNKRHFRIETPIKWIQLKNCWKSHCSTSYVGIMNLMVLSRNRFVFTSLFRKLPYCVCPFLWTYTYDILKCTPTIAQWINFYLSGKGDLVGCDISQHLMNCQNGQGGSNQHGSSGSQDTIVKSSSDVKVMYCIPYPWSLWLFQFKART